MPRRVRPALAVIASFVLVLSVAVTIFVIRRPATIGFAGSVPSQSRLGPVLLVPGYGDKKVALDKLADRIEAATGRTATVINLIGNGTGDLNAEARVLDGDILDQINLGAPSVDLIGYSAGGVVVRLLFDHFDAARDVRRVITLGAPFHGTAVATLAAIFAGTECPAACKQLAPVNALIVNLDTTPLPRGLPWLAVWSTNDSTVTPPDSARMPGAINVPAQSICPHEVISHSGLPDDPLVDGLILSSLGTGPIPRPTASECTALRSGPAALQ
jgi:triacylglycerol lipase